jgi:NAD(P)-dependent dehydrogenase (short-subunit alcohol dehydrogenase family)
MVAVKLTGQIAIVTGGGRGIGRAIARALAAAGAAVAVTARTEDQLRETVALIAADGGHAEAVAGDVTDPATVASTVRLVEERLGPVDVLVNNAGAIGPEGGPDAGDVAAWWQACAVNLYAPYLWARAVLPRMVDRRRGRIITVASNAGISTSPGGDAYAVSKAATIRLCESLALGLEGQGVAVFAMGPGNVRSDMSLEYLRRRADAFPGAIEDPGRYLKTTLDQPAALCVALASGRADALTGRYLTVADDLDDLIKRADEIRQRNLYTLRLRT